MAMALDSGRRFLAAAAAAVAAAVAVAVAGEAAAVVVVESKPVLFVADADSQEGAIHIHRNGIPPCSHGQANPANNDQKHYIYTIQ
jgi:hypothetical protein